MRAWFRSNGYLEVSTPVLSPTSSRTPIANFATQYISEFLGSRELYLVPSPEIHMKKVIAALKRNIYQFSPCFRNSEQVGAHHNPEFTMLAYYTVDADEQLSIAITEELFARTALPGFQNTSAPIQADDVAQACKTYAGFDLDSTQSTTRLRKEANA